MGSDIASGGGSRNDLKWMYLHMSRNDSKWVQFKWLKWLLQPEFRSEIQNENLPIWGYLTNSSDYYKIIGIINKKQRVSFPLFPLIHADLRISVCGSSNDMSSQVGSDGPLKLLENMEKMAGEEGLTPSCCEKVWFHANLPNPSKLASGIGKFLKKLSMFNTGLLCWLQYFE